MAYATATDATDRYGTDYVITSCDRNGDGSLDTTAFGQALDDASDWIDGCLIGHYDLPLAVVPALLKRYCVDIAIFFASEEAGTMTDQKRERFTRAETFLKEVAAGKRRLVSSGAAATGKNKTLSVQLSRQRDQRTELQHGSRRWTRDKNGGEL